jgi:predicted kinase
LIVVRGLMGTGKSTLATALADTLGAELAPTDRVRRELFGPSEQPALFNEGLYRPQTRAQVYQELLRRAEQALEERLPVVLDGTFLSAADRSRAVELARERGAIPLVVRCRCPQETAMRRIADRAAGGATLSEARPELFQLQRQQEQADPPSLISMDLDTTESLPSQLRSVLVWLKQTVR